MNMPIVTTDTFQGDILSSALSHRIVNLTGEINDVTATLINSQLLHLAMLSDEDIQLYINSPGGSVTAGLAIIDTMHSLPCDVSVVVAGMAASMGALIASSGTRGKRRILSHSSMLLHQPSINHVGGKESDVRIVADWITSQRELLNQMLAENTGQPLEKIENDTQRGDYYLSAKAALEYGLVDEIIGEK